MLQGRQIKAARALLGWSQDDLAVAAGLSANTIRNIESGQMSPRCETTRVIRQVIENAGMEFISSEGVRARPEEIKIIHGPNSCKEVLDDIYQTIRARSGDVVAIFKTQNLVEEFYDDAKDTIENMQRLSQITTVKHLVGESFYPPEICSNIQFRVIGAKNIGPISIIAYGNKHAVVLANGDDFKFAIFSTFGLAQAYREYFQSLWEHAIPLSSNTPETTKHRGKA